MSSRITLFGVTIDDAALARSGKTEVRRLPLRQYFTRRHARRWAIASGLLILLLAIGLGLRLWRNRTPSLHASPAALAGFVESERFHAMPLAQRLAYLDALRSRLNELSPQDRRGIFREFGRAQMERHLEQYFALAPGKAREQYLDRELARFGRRPGPLSRNGPPRNGPPGGVAVNRSGRSRDARLRDRYENTPPGQKAMMAQFLADLRKHMARH
jgi:hypothetical protein